MRQVLLFGLVIFLAVTWCHAAPAEKDLSDEDSDDAVEASEKDLVAQLQDLKGDAEDEESESSTKVRAAWSFA